MDEFTVSGYEQIQKVGKKQGNGAHAYIPKEWAGEQLSIIRTSDSGMADGLTPLVDDPFESPMAAHMLTVGDSDSGMNHSVNRRVARWGMNNEDRTVLFCGMGGREEFIEAIGGTHLVLDGSTKINPFDISSSMNENFYEEVDIRRGRTEEVVALLAEVLRRQGYDPNDYESVIHSLIRMTYERAGITSDSDTHDEEPPIIDDLIESTREVAHNPEAIAPLSRIATEQLSEKAAQLLEIFTVFEEGGVYSNMNGQMELHIEPGDFTYIDLRQFTDFEEKSVMSHLVQIYLDQLAMTLPGETIVVMSEMEHLLKNPTMRGILERMIRHWRHYDAGLWLITDSPSLLTKDDFDNESPMLVEHCHAIEFFRTRLMDKITAQFDLGIEQSDFLRTDAASELGEGGYSEGLIRKAEKSGWSKFRQVSSPIEDAVLFGEQEYPNLGEN